MSSVEHDAPYPGFERAVAAKGASLAYGGRKSLLHCVACSFSVARHARRDACEHVEAAPVQGLELIQAGSGTSHISLTRRMSDFFSRCEQPAEPGRRAL